MTLVILAHHFLVRLRQRPKQEVVSLKLGRVAAVTFAH